MRFRLLTALLLLSIESISQGTMDSIPNLEYDSLISYMRIELVKSFMYDAIGEDSKPLTNKVILLAEEAIQRKADDPLSYNYRGHAYKSQGDYYKALIDFSKASRLNPDDLFYLKFKGQCKKELKDYIGAIEAFSTLIEKPHDKDFEYFSVYSDRAYCLSMIGRITESIMDYDEVIRIDPENGLAYFLRGLTKMQLQNKENEACIDLSTSLELGYEDALNAIREYYSK